MPRTKRYDHRYQHQIIFDVMNALFDFTHSFHKLFQSRPYNHNNFRLLRKIDLLGALQAFANMKKDFTDTFKPYKGSYQQTHEMLQPIYGIGNFLKGAVVILYGVALLAELLIFSLIHIDYWFLNGDQSSRWPSFKDILLVRLIIILDGVANVIRGITQIAFTPFTYFIKMPLRGILSLFKEPPLAEQNKSLSGYIDELMACFNDKPKDRDYIYIVYLLQAIDAKFQKSVNRDQKTLVCPHEEFKLMLSLYDSFPENRSSSISKENAEQEKIMDDNYRKYIQFFRPSTVFPVKNARAVTETQNEQTCRL